MQRSCTGAMAIVSLVDKLGGGGGGDQNNSAVFNSSAAELYSWMKASVSSAQGGGGER